MKWRDAWMALRGRETSSCEEWRLCAEAWINHNNLDRGRKMNKFTQEEAEALARSMGSIISTNAAYEILADTLRAKGLLQENKKPITERGYHNISLAISGATTPSRTIPVSELEEYQRAVEELCDGVRRVAGVSGQCAWTTEKLTDALDKARREGLIQ